MTLVLKWFDRAAWSQIADKVHGAVFQESRPPDFERYDFVIVAEEQEGEKLVGYCTCAEVNSEIVKLNFGGVMPNFRRTPMVVESYRFFLNALRSRYHAALTLIKNDNLPSLKLAMSQGFRVVGVTNYRGDILLELLLNLKGA